MEYNKIENEQMSGNIYKMIKEQRYEEIEKILEMSLALEKNNTEIINLIGLVKYRQCKFMAAKEFFKYSYNIDKNKTALEFLVKYNTEEQEYLKFENIINQCTRKEYKKAVKELEANVFLREEFLIPNIILILLYYKIGNIGKALLLIRKIKETHKDSLDKYNLNIIETVTNKCIIRWYSYILIMAFMILLINYYF